LSSAQIRYELLDELADATSSRVAGLAVEEVNEHLAERDAEATVVTPEAPTDYPEKPGSIRRRVQRTKARVANAAKKPDSEVRPKPQFRKARRPTAKLTRKGGLVVSLRDARLLHLGRHHTSDIMDEVCGDPVCWKAELEAEKSADLSPDDEVTAVVFAADEAAYEAAYLAEEEEFEERPEADPEVLEIFAEAQADVHPDRQLSVPHRIPPHVLRRQLSRPALEDLDLIDDEHDPLKGDPRHLRARA